MRTIMISDIHGQLTALKELLLKVNYIPKQDKLILLGDYVDRGQDSYNTIQFIQELKVKDNQVILLKGNHDDNLVEAFEGKLGQDDLYLWIYRNGGYQTFDSFCKRLNKNADNALWNLDENLAKFNRIFNKDIQFLKDLPLYAEDEYHIYVHAGLNPYMIDWRTSSKNEFLFIRDRFILNDLKDIDKTVIFGHTICKHMNKDESYSPFFDYHNGQLKKIGIDGGAGSNKQLNALLFENGKYHVEYVEIEKE